MESVAALAKRVEGATAIFLQAEKLGVIMLATCQNLYDKALVYTAFLQDILEQRLSPADVGVAAALWQICEFCQAIEENLKIDGVVEA